MSLRERVAGVDFSGAKNAGRNIWVAEGRSTPQGVAVERLTRAADLPGGGAAFDTAMTALVSHVASLGHAVVGFDFPFGLPKPLVGARTWTGFAERFARDYTTPDDFRNACRARTGGKELKRRTDADAKVPWCAYNLRLYRQTWAGIRHVLWPLVRNGDASAMPMQAIRDGRPALAEICPASLLKREGLYLPYKGRGDALAGARAHVVDELVARRALRPVPGDIRAAILANPGGDALDAVLAAVGAARADEPEPRDALDRIEARIFY